MMNTVPNCPAAYGVVAMVVVYRDNLFCVDVDADVAVTMKTNLMAVVPHCSVSNGWRNHIRSLNAPVTNQSFHRRENVVQPNLDMIATNTHYLDEAVDFREMMISAWHDASNRVVVANLP